MTATPFKHPPTPPAIPVRTPEDLDWSLDNASGGPKWELKPHETVCNVCWLVNPCACL